MDTECALSMPRLLQVFKAAMMIMMLIFQGGSLLSFCGVIMAPKGVHVLISETCEYITLEDKRDFLDFLRS